jgi:hypothetical protein
MSVTADKGIHSLGVEAVAGTVIMNHRNPQLCAQKPQQVHAWSLENTVRGPAETRLSNKELGEGIMANQQVEGPNPGTLCWRLYSDLQTLPRAAHRAGKGAQGCK